MYYGENTFAVEIPVAVETGRKSKSGRVSLETARKWMAALDKGGRVGTIKKWALSVVVPAGDVAGTGTARAKNDREVLISLQYPKSGTKKQVQPEVEIHRQGSCLLPRHEEYRQCVRMCYPCWVDDALAAAFLAEKEDRGKQVMLFAATVEKKGYELVESRCVQRNERVTSEERKDDPDAKHELLESCVHAAAAEVIVGEDD